MNEELKQEQAEPVIRTIPLIVPQGGVVVSMVPWYVNSQLSTLSLESPPAPPTPHLLLMHASGDRRYQTPFPEH